MKNHHSIQYYEKRLKKLERVADAINYPIDKNFHYVRAATLLPLSVVLGGTGKEPIPDAFFGAFVAACEAVEMARRGGGGEMLTGKIVRDALREHGCIFKECTNREGTVKEFHCYCYGYNDAFDIIRWTLYGGWWLIDVAGNSEPLTLEGLRVWLGY